MSDEDEDDTYYRRAAIHGDFGHLVPETLLTREELDDIIEVIYYRDRDEYSVNSRYLRNGVLHLRHGVCDGIKDAATLAIDVARDEGHPILRRVYTYVPSGEDEEPGEDRIPRPWYDDDEVDEDEA